MTNDPSTLRQALERLSAMEWIAHKPFCAVMGQDARFGWRDGDEAVCNCGLSALLAGERLAQEEPGRHLSDMLQLNGPGTRQQIAAAFCRHWADMLRVNQPWDTPETMARCLEQVAKALDEMAEPASPPAHPAQEPTALHGELRALLDTAWHLGPDLYAHVMRIGLREMRKTIEAASRPAAPAPSDHCIHAMNWDARGGSGTCVKCHQRLVCRNAKRTASGRLDCGLPNVQCGYPSCMIPFEQAPIDQE